MNSYMRQTSMPMEQMHSFLRDKQAWENAIAVYDGPDPLDHWYNYICWYENHLHGDTPSDYRRTLERCLTIFEHTVYYYNDHRLVRLWLKYVAMQDDKAKERYYKVLHNRGVGKQIAALYVSWANFYESINQLQDAEDTYNLALQEKAQPYIEIQNAHHKFMYKCSMLRDQHRIKQQFQQQLQQQHQLDHHHAQNQQLNQQHPHHHTQHHSNQQHLQHNQNQHNHSVNYQQQQHHDFSQQHGSHNMPCQGVQMHQAQFPQYRFQEVYQHQVHHHHQPTPHPHLPVQHPQQQQQHSSPMYGQLAHYPSQHTYEQSQFQFQSQNVYTESSSASPANYANQQSISSVTEEEHLSASQVTQNSSPTQTVEQYSQQNEEQQEMITPTETEQSSTPIEPFKYPKHFYSYSKNNYEKLETALFLEEPADPCRQCHYDKAHVYPANAGTEFSPEELRAQKYLKRIREVQQQRSKVTYVSKGKKIEQCATQYQQLQNVAHGQSHYYTDQQYTEAGFASINNNNIYESSSSSSYAKDHKEADNDDEEEDDDDDDDDEEDDEAGDEDDNKYDTHALQQRDTTATIVNDMEQQMSVSKIRFSTQTPEQDNQHKKSLKIKFKKKRPQGEGASGDNTYTIENISQSDTANSAGQETPVRRNGFSFHPYKNSTPKTTSKRSKSKLKKAAKFPIAPCSSSNSSSADNVAIANGTDKGTTEKVRTADNAITNAAFNDNANYSFLSAATHDNSNCSSLGQSSYRGESTIGPNTAAAAEISTYQENSYFATQNDVEAKTLRLHRALDIIELHMGRTELDPFNSELCRAFLTKLGFPGTEDANANYKVINTMLPKINVGRSASVTDVANFIIEKEIGRGSYGSVYKATDAGTGKVVAVKFQKPASTWEIYICDQVIKRIKATSVKSGLMNVSTAIIAPNASLIATEFSQFGSLLDVNNKVRQATHKAMPELLVMLFSAQICEIIHYLHKSEIIHADIKPDNFLLMRVPSNCSYPSVRLIDFGCAIDMKLFPKDTRFQKKIETDGFKCIEMQEGRTWTYETDYFCVAATIYVMLMGEYMQIQKQKGIWDTKSKIPRYLRRDIWTQFYHEMLNLKQTELPDLLCIRDMFKSEVSKYNSELHNHIRTLSNILHRR